MARNLDDKEIDDLPGKASAWLGTATQQLNCTAPIDVTTVKCSKAYKDDLAKLLSEAYQLVRFQNDRLKIMKTALSETKTELISSQNTVIDLQEKLLENKDQLLQSVKTAVSTSV